MYGMSASTNSDFFFSRCKLQILTHALKAHECRNLKQAENCGGVE